jgi:DNA-binding MarR family transcriptional regulator/GNAT superfamily N-acetyltransferase
MVASQIAQVRSFNRLVTQRLGALDESYLKRGRPLGQARLIYEIGEEGADLGALRDRLRLDSGYLSRLLRALEAQRLIVLRASPDDKRRRRVVLTAKGARERATYDRLSDQLASAMLEPLDESRRERLVRAMSEVERLIRSACVEVAIDSPESDAARLCLAGYLREIDERFEHGFDLANSPTPPPSEMTPPSGAFVVARLFGEPVGCGGLKQVSDRVGEIKRVWTSPTARGLGVARKVIGELEALARKMGLERLRLDTNRALTEAHALYRREGYREITPFNDNPYAHHWFEKRL